MLEMIPGFFYARLGREVNFLTIHTSQLIAAVISNTSLLLGTTLVGFSDRI